MTSAKNVATQEPENVKKSTFEWISRSLTPGSTWNNADEILDTLYWGRQIFSVFFGLLLGICNVTGFWAIILYLLLCYRAIKIYLTRIQKLDAEDLGGMLALNQEGFMEGFAAFMVTWIAAHTALTT